MTMTKKYPEGPLKAVMQSQDLAHRAINLCESAFTLLEFGGKVELYRRECERAAAACFRVAREIAMDARKIAEDDGTELPPNVEDALRKALEAKP